MLQCVAIGGADFAVRRNLTMYAVIHCNHMRPGSGAGATALAAVPEPATLVLLMFAAVGLCLRRGRAA